MIAALHGSIEVIRLLVEYEGCMQDRYGQTALMLATRYSRLECAKLLADKEKDVKTTRKYLVYPPGSTALDIARKIGLPDIVKVLLK